MAIEFRCSQCNQLLRVPDESVGKNARCPKCQALMQVPPASTAAAPAADTAETTSLPAFRPASPFAAPSSPPGSSPPPPPFTPAPPAPPKASDPSAFGNPFAEQSGVPKPGVNPFGAGGPAAPSMNPYAAPSGGYAYQQTAFATPGGPIRNVAVPLDPIMGHAWRVWQANLGILLGTTVIFLGISYAVALPIGFLQGALEKDNPEAAVAVALLGNIFSNLVQMFLGIGQAQIALKLARGLPASVGDLFGGGSRFLPILGGSILAGIVLFAGFLLCIVPGILLMIWFWPFYYLIVDEKAGIIDSFSLASTITEGNRATAVIIWVVSVGIGILGCLAFCVGVLFAIPLISLLWATAYLMMSGQLSVHPQYAR